MKCFNNSSLTNQQESLVKRYREIHFDFSNEFKNTSVRPCFVVCCAPSLSAVIVLSEGGGAAEAGEHGADGLVAEPARRGRQRRGQADAGEHRAHGLDEEHQRSDQVGRGHNHEQQRSD